MSEVFTPRTPQRLGLDFLQTLPRRNLLADMGLGKSVTTATELDRMFSTGESRPALVMAPLRVARMTWPDEFRKWNHLHGLDYIDLSGSPGTKAEARQREEAYRKLDAGNTQVALCNYEQIPKLVERYGKRWPFGCHVADEVSKLKGFRLKGQGSQRAGALGKVAHLPGTSWIGLSGTPCANGIQDLWGLMWFVDRGERLGRSYTAFLRRWFRPKFGSQFGEIEPMPHAAGEIQALVAGVSLVLRASDFFDLPPVVHNKVYVEMPPAARKMYRQMEREMFVQLEHTGVDALSAASKSVKCRQLASGILYYDKDKWEHVHAAKIEGLRSVVEEAGGNPVLVSYFFQADLEKLRTAFPEGRVLDKDPATLDAWNRREIGLLFAHPDSCGHGINMQQGSNHLCYYSMDFKLESFQQIAERLGPVRQMQAGLHRPVVYHYLIVKGTVEEHVFNVVTGKATVQEEFKKALIDFRNRQDSS